MSGQVSPTGNRRAGADGDYDACRQVLAHSGSSFALPIRLLPAAKRRATTALYAFCRLADDITDVGIGTDASAKAAGLGTDRGDGPRQSLDRLRRGLQAAIDGDGEHPILRAVADAARRYGIPVRLLHDIIDGVAMDLETRRFARFEELEEYCGKVASAVGLAAIHIWGFLSERAMEPGHACGVAFQLTNILRDVREDAVVGRIYLPLEDFEACGVDPDSLVGSPCGPGRCGSRSGSLSDPMEAEAYRLVLDRSVTRATEFFRRACALDGLLSTDGRLVFRAMYGTYAAIFRRIAALPERVLAGRVMPSKASLAFAAASCLVVGPRPASPWRMLT